MLFTAAAALVAGVLVGFGDISEVTSLYISNVGLKRLVFWGMPCAVLVSAIIAKTLSVRSRTLNFVLQKLGDVSYSTYVSHLLTVGFAANVFSSVGIPGALVFICCIVIGHIGGVVLYHLVEKPSTEYISKRLPTDFKNRR